MALQEYILLDEAARRYKVDREILTRLVESGKIRAVKIDGRVAVNHADMLVLSTQVEAASDGDELVSMSEAARRLGIDISYVAHWVEYGWLPVLGRGKRRAKLISFNQARALARLRNSRGPHRGSRLIPRHQEVAS